MKTCVRLWQYLTEFVLEWEIFQIKRVEKSKHTFKFNNIVDNVGKYGKAGQDTDDNIIQRRKDEIFMPDK